MKRQDELNDAWCKYMNKCSTEIMQALAFALRWCDEHPHWISVKEQLPPKEAVEDEFITDMSIDVLATDGKTIHICFYDHILERWLYGDFWQLDNISYWMYLPSVEHLRETTKMIEKGGKK